MARRICSKCNGTGKYCMGIENGRPYSRTGFTCYPCHGTGYVGTKSKKQHREQLASPEFRAEVEKKLDAYRAEVENFLAGKSTPLEKYAAMKIDTREYILIYVVTVLRDRLEEWAVKYGDDMKLGDKMLIAAIANREIIAEFEKELATIKNAE